MNVKTINKGAKMHTIIRKRLFLLFKILLGLVLVFVGGMLYLELSDKAYGLLIAVCGLGFIIVEVTDWTETLEEGR